MKFSICGGLDCPDWLLAEIAAMSSVSSLKLKLITSKVGNYLTFDLNIIQYRVKMKYFHIGSCIRLLN